MLCVRGWFVFVFVCVCVCVSEGCVLCVCYAFVMVLVLVAGLSCAVVCAYWEWLCGLAFLRNAHLHAQPCSAVGPDSVLSKCGAVCGHG